MPIQNSLIDKVNVIHFADKVNAEHSQIVQRQIERFKCGAQTKIMLDFSQLRHIDSTILGLVLKFWLEIKQLRGRVLLFAPKQQPLMKLRRAKMYSLFAVEYDQERAISRLCR